MVKPSFDRLSSSQALSPGYPAPFLFADGISSVETLLTNIQGLLKVAVENARVQDNQIQAEKRELKMELYREREMRESLERQLTSELQSRASIQKRLKKEKKAKRKLQEALEFESKRRETLERSLKHSASPPPPSSPSPPPSSPSPPYTLHTSSNDFCFQECNQLFTVNAVSTCIHSVTRFFLLDHRYDSTRRLTRTEGKPGRDNPVVHVPCVPEDLPTVPMTST
ncbi:hypothetical protein J4Q44_G00053340 [Coregonus suidteri]|uniref:Uncharacterized protein n=1 Tax=Coregonus suidteri TaxID=861788 RepID=A0AAN8M1L7_9TELE